MPARWLDADVVLRAGRDRRVHWLIGAAFVLYLFYHLTRFQFAQMWPIVLVGDAAILFEASRDTFIRAAYPDGTFPYSPSAVILFRVLGLAGPTAFMLGWYLLMAAGLVVSLRAAVAQERDEIRAAWPLIGIVAVIIAGSPVSWDLRNANSNLVYLGLVMAGYGLAGRRPLLAGVLVGLSVSLKLYSGLLLGWLMVNGPRRMFYAGAAAMIVLWILLPLALFGFEGTVRLYIGWREQVAHIADLAYHTALAANRETGPPLITLHKAIVNLTGASFQSSITHAWLWVLRAIWLAALLWYAWRCRHCLFAAAPSRAALADWTVLLIAPLPFSPWLEPYHAIPLLIGAMLCTAIALDKQVERRDRTIALAALVGLALFLMVRVPFAIRGLQILAQFLMLTIALGLLRPRLPRSPASETAHAEKWAEIGPLRP
jgi:glycosyl transferase family 87